MFRGIGLHLTLRAVGRRLVDSACQRLKRSSDKVQSASHLKYE